MFAWLWIKKNGSSGNFSEQQKEMKYNDSPILLFDGVCNLCNGTVQFIIKRDPKGKLKFAALQSDSGQALLKKFNLRTDHFDSFVFIKEEKYFLKSRAVLEVLKELGGVWKIFYIFLYLPRPFRDFVYDIVAKSRYKIFGKKNQCMVPSSEIEERFLK